MHEVCKERFREMEERITAGDKILSEHTTEIAVAKTDISNLIKSLCALTKALWAICGTIVTTLFGFFMWYIQNI